MTASEKSEKKTNGFLVTRTQSLFWVKTKRKEKKYEKEISEESLNESATIYFYSETETPTAEVCDVSFTQSEMSFTLSLFFVG